MRRQLTVVLLAAAVAVTGCASATTTAVPRPLPTGKRTATQTIKVGGRTRSWVQTDPRYPRAGSIPIIVVLSGITATAQQEMARDKLLGLASSGRAELVYPVGVDKSWNAGGCCGKAAKMHVNDVAFLQALVPRLDPGQRRPIYLAGYSNGGRLAYRIACTDPALFSGYAVVKAMPEPGCVVTKPVSLLQIDSMNDKAVAYRPGDHGREHPAATVEVSHLQGVDGCPSSSTASSHGELKLTTWTGCKAGTRLAFAVYSSGWHSWPRTTPTTPGAAPVIWTFLSALPPPRP
jgi:polyhydroxybutyrate depolymerase